MKHENYRESLALRLYGELEGEELKQLEQHLEGCQDCSAYALELEQGLGRLIPAREAELELPASWREHLETSIATRRRSVLPSWFTTAASFAAGLLVMAALRTPAQEATGPEGIETEVTFALDAPPPKFDGSGGMARLALFTQR